MLELDRSDVLAIGDSLRTDVLGARLAGLEVVLIASGAHRDALGYLTGRELDESSLMKLLTCYPARPTFVASRFEW